MLAREESMKKRKSGRKSNYILEKRIVRMIVVLLFFASLLSVCEKEIAGKMASMEIGRFKEQKVEKFEPIQLSKLEIQEKESQEFNMILGRLNGFLTDIEQNELQELHHSVFHLVTNREQKGDFKETSREKKIWDKLAGKLDHLTDLYLQGKPYNYEENRTSVDYGQRVIDRLKKIMNEEDIDKLLKYRDEYLRQEGNIDESVQNGLSDIITKYPQLNQEIILVILLDDKEMENQAVYKIKDNLDLEYEDVDKVGLDEISDEEDENFQTHWKAVKEIIPSDILKNFTYFKIGSDGEYGIFAYVMRLDGEGKEWCLNYDPADYVDDGTFPYTIVHEISHYLSLNEEQVQYYYEDVQGFPSNRYSDQECIAKKDSYLQKFYLEFWANLTPVWKVNPESPKFYERHKNEFVTPYASTSCGEDFAESLAAYILMDRAPTPETRSKFAFFESIPELKALKKEIAEKVLYNQVIVSPEIN